MDFTLSLAHFCELHGPTSVLCTQALPAECSTCFSTSPVTSPPQSSLNPSSEPLSVRPAQQDQPTLGTYGEVGSSSGQGCASCRMSLPDDTPFATQSHLARASAGRIDRPPLRTKEEVHICVIGDPGSDDDDDDDLHPAFPASYHSSHSDLSCHSHSLEYVSNSSPAESETFSSLRRATIRTLSGENIPRDQSSGPLWFGDPVTGYTIAYIFRLADLHARGRQRYYALLALAGKDTQRAFDACTLIWAFFERIAMNIVQMAESVAARSCDDESPHERGQITPISSFLTGRTMDPDGYPRRGVASVRANGIAELVDNDNFFCELHMMFVGILQDLGKLLGGMRVRRASPDFDIGHLERTSHFPSSISRGDENVGPDTIQEAGIECTKTHSMRPPEDAGFKLVITRNSPALMAH